MIETGPLSKYEQAINEEFGDDAERLRMALAACWRGREHLQNRIDELRADIECCGEFKAAVFDRIIKEHT